MRSLLHVAFDHSLDEERLDIGELNAPFVAVLGADELSDEIVYLLERERRLLGEDVTLRDRVGQG